MFYSRQLLARKAPLGQIWIAATTHAKISRRNLDKLNIIKICEEILNPSVPMALRLSGILMGGVVIVYERKVKLLYDDVTRLLVELNEAWKVKAGAGSHSIDLPPRRFRAKYEDITLPDNVDGDASEDERFHNFSNTATFVGLQQGDYICVSLDNVDETYIIANTGEDVVQDNHQVDAENITLWEPSNLCETDINLLNQNERFHEDGVIQLDSEPAEQVPFTPRIPSPPPVTRIPYPPHQNQHQKGDLVSKFQDLHQANQVNQEPDDHNEAYQPEQNQPRNKQIRKRGRRPTTFMMDDEQIVIPGNIYQSWLQDASDVVSRREKKRKNPFAGVLNIPNLMKLPPTVLTNGILTTGLRETNYPPQLLELWTTSIQVPHDSPSGRNGQPQPSKPSSPSNRVHRHQDPTRLPLEYSSTGVGSTSIRVSIEKHRGINDHNEPEFGVLLTSLRQELIYDNTRTTEVVIGPGSSGGTISNEVRSFPGSDSGHGPPSQTFEPNSGRINRKRPYPWSRHSGSSLEPVDEEYGTNSFDANFELTKVSENGVTLENELIVETDATQTQRPFIPIPMEKTTDSIRMHLKMHFETPGAPPTESLDRLASGMDRPKAAKLFYQTCVLASCGSINVEQKEPYGDILISRGEKM